MTAHLHVLSVSLFFPSNISISHGSFDLNTNCKIPGFGVDSIIPSGLDSARYLNAMSSFRRRHHLCIHLIFEPTAHVNSPQKVNLRLPHVQMWGWKGSSRVFQWGKGDEGRSEHTGKGTALPASGPPGASLPLHGSPTVCLDTEDSVTPGLLPTIDNKTCW